MGVGAVNVGRILVDLGGHLAGKARARRHGLARHQAAVGRGRVGLQPRGAGEKAGVAQAVEKGARDQRAFLVDGGLLLDHRRERHDLVPVEAELPGRRPGRVGRRGLQLREPPIKLGLELADHLAGVAVERQPVGRRKEVALRGLGRDAELLHQRPVSARRQEHPRRRHVQLLEPPRDVEAVEALGQGDLVLLAGRGAGQQRHELAGREVVGQEVGAGDEQRRVRKRARVHREARGAPHDAAAREQLRGRRRVEPRPELDLDDLPAPFAPRSQDGEQPAAGEERRERQRRQRDPPGASGAGAPPGRLLLATGAACRSERGRRRVDGPARGVAGGALRARPRIATVGRHQRSFDRASSHACRMRQAATPSMTPRSSRDDTP